MRHCLASRFSFKGVFYYRFKVSKNPMVAVGENPDKLGAEAQIRCGGWEGEAEITLIDFASHSQVTWKPPSREWSRKLPSLRVCAHTLSNGLPQC